MIENHKLKVSTIHQLQFEKKLQLSNLILLSVTTRGSYPIQFQFNHPQLFGGGRGSEGSQRRSNIVVISSYNVNISYLCPNEIFDILIASPFIVANSYHEQIG